MSARADRLSPPQRAMHTHCFLIGVALGTPVHRASEYGAGRFGRLNYGMLHEFRWVSQFIIWC